jgi:tetratricopeptide (TPR) repeat protein
VDAHAALGSVKFYHDWDFAGAETEYRRAMELGQETFRANIVVYLALVGRFDEAIALQRRIMESNPLYPDYMILEWVYYEAKRFDEAIAVTNGDLEINPSFSYRKLFRSNCYALKGMCVEALADIQNFLTESPSYKPDQSSLTLMGNSYALCGERKKAEECIDAIKRLPDFDPINLAYIYSTLNEKDLALAALEKTFERRSPVILYIKVEPMFDPLRDDPRFIALLKKIGFEK